MDARSSQPNAPRHKFLSWTVKGGLALFDQGVFSGCNFISSILLARWLSSDGYGAYAIAFAAYLLLLMLYQSVLLEPMAVFGASDYKDCLWNYMRSVLQLHFAIAGVILAALVAFAVVALKIAPSGGLPGALLGLAIAGPLVLMLGLLRRSFYLEFSPAPAVFGASVYCILTLAALFLVYRYRLLSPMTAMLVTGAGALVPSVFLLMRLKATVSRGPRILKLSEVWKRHWRYGRWALAGYTMMWIPANIFYPLVGSFGGMTQAGELKALTNLASPVLQTYAAISALLLPYAAHTLKEQRAVGAGKLAARITIFSVLGATVYWCILLASHGPVFRLLYGGRYTEVGYLLPVVALGSVSCSAFFGSGTVLRALQSPALVFIAVCVSNCISLAIGVPATRALGLKGAVWSMAASETLNFIVVVILLTRMLRLRPRSAENVSLAPLSAAPDSLI